MSKPSTPVRRSKVGPGRPGSAGGEIPLTASMEVLTPDPCVSASLGPPELRRSQDVYTAPTGAKPRTPGSANLVRTRSTDGRRASGPHEVITLNSTTSKIFSANQILAHPLILAAPAGSSPSCSVVGASGVGLPLQSPYTGGPAQGGAIPSGWIGGSVGSSHVSLPPDARSQTHPDVSVSTASSRFNPVMEDDDDMLPLHRRQQPQQAPRTSTDGEYPQGGEIVQNSQVLLGGSAVVVAQRAAAAAAGNGSIRRYATTESVAVSRHQEQQQEEQRSQTGEASGMTGDNEEGGSSGAVRDRLIPQDSEVPGTPESVASGRVGGVFFTDLHRSFGGAARTPGVSDSQDLRGALAAKEDGEGAGDDDEADILAIESSRQGRISIMTSRLNPMQSPTMSEDGGDGDEGDDSFAEYAGEELRSAAEAGSGSVQEAGGRRASTSEMTDYTNPVQTPYDSRLATPLLPSAGAPTAAESDTATTETPLEASGVAATTSESQASLLLVIRDLYVTDSELRASSDPNRPVSAANESVTQMPVMPELQPEGGGEDEGEAEIPADDSEALFASRAAVAALAARTESEQFQRRSELGEYMTSLQELKDESGDRLVELPADWGIMLERLFRQRRAEFETLQGWMGPRRFEDLPINQLPSDHPDPRVEEGLARIRELDAVLNDKLIAALISHRETFPEQWAEQERKRLERHTKAVEEALKRERQKRLRAARLSRAVNSLDGPAALAASSPSVQGSSRSLAPQASSLYSRLFTLKPEEEALVEAVMRRNDDEGIAINPFDLESEATYGSVPDRVTADGDGGEPLADPDDIDLDLDMMLPSASASACATPSAAGPRLRPLSARLTEAYGSALRPLSASSHSSSRPGTSSGPAGGMSPLAAAALHGHPALMAAAFAAGAAGVRTSVGVPNGTGGLLPGRVYDDPRAAARALRAINARLAAFESEHLWDESGALADFKSVTSTQNHQGRKQQALETGTEAISAQGPGPASAAPPAAAGAGSVGVGVVAHSSPIARSRSPPRSVRSAVGGPAVSVSGASVTAGGQRDYLREERIAKELAMRERDVDAALRNLKTGEVVRLGEATLKALVEQCRRLQELNEHRRKIEEAEAAARKAHFLRQQLMVSRASESGSGRGTPKGASNPNTNGNSSSRAQTQQPAGAALSKAGKGPTTAPADGGSVRAGKPPSGASASASGAQAGGVVGAAAGATGGGTATRQSSAGKSRRGTSSSSTGTGSLVSISASGRRASDPASVSTAGGLGTAGSGSTTAASTSTPGSGTPISTSKGGKAFTAVSASVTSTPESVSKPRSGGKAGGTPSELDGRGGLPPPPPPPPP